jgi:hypothetical protein
MVSKLQKFMKVHPYTVFCFREDGWCFKLCKSKNEAEMLVADCPKGERRNCGPTSQANASAALACMEGRGGGRVAYV